MSENAAPQLSAVPGGGTVVVTEKFTDALPAANGCGYREVDPHLDRASNWGIRYPLQVDVANCGPGTFLVPVRGFDTYCKPIFPVKLAFEIAMKIA
jgi:hypothetical protein